ncbi:MAG: YjbQ family protein [Clostridia bacterium]|nr:YjbQ family protein [Clostridia bacterium]
MKVYHELLKVQTKMQVTFDDVTDKVGEIIEKQGIKNGIVTIFSQHTSCSVFIQEDSEGVTYKNISLILQDTVNCLEKIIPTCEYEGQYLHPGEFHVKEAERLRGERPEWCLNTDGHIKSSVMGRSETVPVVDGKMTLGEFGRIYFADFDKTRPRERKVRVHIIGE